MYGLVFVVDKLPESCIISNNIPKPYGINIMYDDVPGSHPALRIRGHHVELHSVKGKMSFYPQAEEDDFDLAFDDDEPDHDELDADQGEAEPVDNNNKGKKEPKIRYGKAVTSEFPNNNTHVTAACFSHENVKGLNTSSLIDSIYMNIASLVTTADKLKACTQNKPFIAPTNEVLEFKDNMPKPEAVPLPEPEALPLPKSKRSRQWEKKREANAKPSGPDDTVVQRLQKAKLSHVKAMADELE